MPSSAALRQQIETAFQHRYPSVLTPSPKTIREVVSTGIPPIDAILNGGIPVGAITELVSGDVYHWGALMAAALIGSVPVVILYSFFVEYYVSAMTGAVKE